MKVVSVNVGLPREIEWRGKTTRTSIFKSPVEGRIRVGRLNLDGDAQSDLRVHGGPDKAVYAYPSEHYAFWTRELPGTDLPWGAFGENLTIEGILEGAVAIGDRLEIGSAELVVTQPRMPCFKLGIRFGRLDMPRRFLLSGRTGFYLRVAQEGEIAPGDTIRLVHDAGGMSIREIFELETADAPSPELLRRAAELPDLSPGWRNGFRERLEGTAE